MYVAGNAHLYTHTHVCMYHVYTHTCTCMYHVHTHMYVCNMCACICIWMYLDVFVFVCIRTPSGNLYKYVHVHMSARAHTPHPSCTHTHRPWITACTHVCAYMKMRVYTSMYVHIWICICIHTCTCVYEYYIHVCAYMNMCAYICICCAPNKKSLKYIKNKISLDVPFFKKNMETNVLRDGSRALVTHLDTKKHHWKYQKKTALTKKNKKYHWKYKKNISLEVQRKALSDAKRALVYFENTMRPRSVPNSRLKNSTIHDICIIFFVIDPRSVRNSRFFLKKKVMFTNKERKVECIQYFPFSFECVQVFSVLLCKLANIYIYIYIYIRSVCLEKTARIPRTKKRVNVIFFWKDFTDPAHLLRFPTIFFFASPWLCVTYAYVLRNPKP